MTTVATAPARTVNRTPPPQANEAAVAAARLHRLLEQVLEAATDLGDYRTRDLEDLMEEFQSREWLLRDVMPFLILAANSAACAIRSNVHPHVWQAALESLRKNRQ